MKNFLKPNSLADYVGAVFVMVAFFVGVVGFWYITSRSTPAIPTPSNRPPLVSCPADFLSYTQLVESPERVVKLIPEKKSMYVESGQFKNSQVVVTKNETATSKVACGYLFIRAGSNKGAVQSWEDVVVDPKGFGGHLNPASAISRSDGDQYSDYLYALNKIQYWPTHARQTVNSADWAALMNVSETVPFTIAFNSEDSSGFVSEVSIAYKCWDPKTGEENDGCKLIVSKSVDSTNPLE